MLTLIPKHTKGFCHLEHADCKWLRGSTEHSYTISLPCEPNGSGELTNENMLHTKNRGNRSPGSGEDF